jgi:hypothetical protein
VVKAATVAGLLVVIAAEAGPVLSADCGSLLLVPTTPTPETATVSKARETFRAVNAKNERVLRPLIDAYLTAYDAVVDDLERAHGLVSDKSDLDLLGPSREAARWLMTGRCIGLARAGLDLVRLGYANEALPTIRSLHEANRLLSVFVLRGEDELVARWIDGRTISRGAVMHASQRQEEAIRVEMLRAGEKPPLLTKSYFDGQYGRWSEFAHHRRKHVVDQVAGEPRIMAIGPHPDWRARAATVDHFGDVLGELISAGGTAFAKSLGPGFGASFQRTFQAVLDLKYRIPLSDLARRRANDA